jgi:hypothetical protein
MCDLKECHFQNVKVEVFKEEITLLDIYLETANWKWKEFTE